MRGKRSTTSPKNAVFSTTCEYAAGMERLDRETAREKLISQEAKENRKEGSVMQEGQAREESGPSGWRKGPQSSREERAMSQTFFDLVVHGERVIGPHVGCNQDLSRVLQHLKDR